MITLAIPSDLAGPSACRGSVAAELSLGWHTNSWALFSQALDSSQPHQPSNKARSANHFSFIFRTF